MRGEGGRPARGPSLAAELDRARLRRLGLAEDAPAPVVDALRREDPARWLPLALATLCATVAALGGGSLDPDDLLESWGLLDPDDAAERNAERSLANFRALAARLNANRQERRDPYRWTE